MAELPCHPKMHQLFTRGGQDEVGGQQANRPFPNRTGHFYGIRLSRDRLHQGRRRASS
jgi:hypothetical protein